MQTEILSKSNPKLKELKKNIKEESRYVLVEGMKLFKEAIKHKIQIEKIYIDKSNISFLSKAYPDYKKCEIYFTGNDILAENYTTDSLPEGNDLILALAKKPIWDTNLLLKQKKNLIFLERIQDPGNLGTILRSSLAFNAGGVCLSKESVAPFNTKVIRASAGAVFGMPVCQIHDFTSFCKEVKKQNYKIIATKAHVEKSLKDLKNATHSVFLFGNEGTGLSVEIINSADEIVSIPHSTKVESLNLGVSVSLLLHELYDKD